MSVIFAENFAYLDQNHPDVNVHTGDAVEMKSGDFICFKFAEAEAEDLFKSLPSHIELHIPLGMGQRPDIFSYNVWTNTSDWNYQTATYNNPPAYGGTFTVGSSAHSHDEVLVLYLSGGTAYVRDALKYGITIQFYSRDISISNSIYTYTSDYTNKPYSEFTYGGQAEYYIDNVIPNNGIILSAGEDNEFSWTFRSSDYILGDIEVLSSFLIWKNVTEGSQEYIIDAGTDLHVTFPANTIMPSSVIDSIQWYVEVELSNDSTLRSSWQDVRFQEGKIRPSLIYPVEIEVHVDNPITFSWNKVGSGTQTGILLSIEQNGEEIFSTDEISYTQNYYEVPANTIQKGVFVWKLKLQNSISEWGDFVSAQATGYASPSVPTSITLSKPYPRFELSWTNADDVEQIGYEIMAVPWQIDSTFNEDAFYTDKTDDKYSYIWYETGREEEAYQVLEPCARYKRYGTETKFTSPKIILVGSVTFYIRILDANGEWSKWLAFDSEIIHMYSGVSNQEVTISTEKVDDDYYYTNTFFKDAKFNVRFDWKDPEISMPNQYRHLYFVNNGVIIIRRFDRAETIMRNLELPSDIILDTSKYVFPDRDSRILVPGSTNRFFDYTSNRDDCFYMVYQLISIEADPTDPDDAYLGKLPGDYIEFYPVGEELDRFGVIDARTNFNFLVTVDDPDKVIAIPIYIYDEQPHTYDISEEADIDFTIFGNNLKPIAGPIKSKSRTYSFSCLTDEWNSQISPYRMELDMLHYSGGNIRITHAAAISAVIGRKILYRDIEGHTIFGVLNSTSRTISSYGYSVWQCTITECSILPRDANKILNAILYSYAMNPNIAFD